MTGPGTAPRTYLIDVENVQAWWTTLLPACRPGDEMVLFVSDKTGRIDPLVLGGPCAKGVKFSFAACENGLPNAMDFQLVAELGRLSVLEPDREFVIISGDNGFRSVVKFMADRGVSVECAGPSDPGAATPAGNATGTAQDVKAVYEQMLREAGAGNADERHVVAAILYQAMLKPPQRRKVDVLNRLRNRWGAAEGQEKYNAIKDVVWKIAANGPWPEKDAAPAPAQPAAKKPAPKPANKPMPSNAALNSALSKVVTMREGYVAKCSEAIKAARAAQDPEQSLRKQVRKIFPASVNEDVVMDALKKYV